MSIVTGLNVYIATKVIKRMKNIIVKKSRINFQDKKNII